MTHYRYRPKLYTASKIDHAPLWKQLREEHPEVEFTSRWIDMAHLEIRNVIGVDNYTFTQCWTIDIQDVRRSDFVLCWGGPNGEDTDRLRGALVEAGAALALGKIVFAVNIAHGSWVHHPCVVRYTELEQVFTHLAFYHQRSTRHGL